MDNPRKILQFIGITIITIVLTRAFVLRINQINATENFSVPTAGASQLITNTTSKELRSQPVQSESDTSVESDASEESVESAEPVESTEPAEPQEATDAVADEGDNLRDESTIYSFLQGPVSWQKRYNWSGSWGELYTEEGAYFGSFSCGLCCIANIYSTLSSFEATPVEVYDYAKENSSYYPTSENSAIGWEAMYSTMSKLGLDVELANKPYDYEDFKNEMANSETAVILVQSDDSDSYWGETAGHYVSLWRYNPTEESVFVANPGKNSRNRKTITLRDCYDNLKIASNYQVLYVRSYDEFLDQWKPQSIGEINWVRPDYCEAPKAVSTAAINVVQEATP